jgi:hypothetical protein
VIDPAGAVIGRQEALRQLVQCHRHLADFPPLLNEFITL